MTARTFIGVPLLMVGALFTPLAVTAAPAATATPKALSLTAKDVQQQYGANYERLQKIKQLYDPNNFYHREAIVFLQFDELQES